MRHDLRKLFYAADAMLRLAVTSSVAQHAADVTPFTAWMLGVSHTTQWPYLIVGARNSVSTGEQPPPPQKAAIFGVIKARKNPVFVWVFVDILDS